MSDHRNPLRPKLDPRLARRLEEKKAELDRYRPLKSNILNRLYGDLRVVLTYHSNAIEGNTLNLRETQMVIENGLTVSGHSLREYLEATNHAEAFDFLVRLVEGNAKISLEYILALHHLVLKGIDDESAGRFRDGPVYIRGATLIPPPARQVPSMLAEWLEWLEESGQSFEPIVRAAIAHHDFEAIHPFFDGNGRTGRLILNLMLMQAGYPPALLLRDWRVNYLRALDTATLGNYSPIANLVGRAVEGGLDLYLEACRQEPEDLYQPLSELAKETGFSADYLGWLVRKGKLAAIKRGRRWYSTLADIDRYKAEVAQELEPKGRPRKQV
ncbi:MAG: Fic family protein [Chloroflexi bacterium]|uniref:Fic family protein n=1 Tax=Candidatus Chlorohelix allophototropha TaxID=3003348 RepID=A0A8T7M4S7_9CHLR|nr:Fic family protein [Chloroflexota bacterium]WJW70264.1 Fic family protein [Chloroflexota bacterium L227-S17]